MSGSKDKTLRLSDYREPEWRLQNVKLTFSLHPKRTRVHVSMQVLPNYLPEHKSGLKKSMCSDKRAPLRLDGRNLQLVDAHIDGKPLTEGDYVIDEESMTILQEKTPQGAFHWSCTTEISPQDNLSLEGLYRSNNVYCTQCEAHGFSRITYFFDRPDILTNYKTRIEADRDLCPVLLSNGDLIETGKLSGNRHYAIWYDPHPKPCYLFALVAGDLVSMRDQFITRSNRKVELYLYTRRHDAGRGGYALDALKRSMAWDETEYGCEYDLDRFMIVAIDDFNMGAMENKGLNIFNSKFVLARPDIATDLDYANIENIVAHEYFHNWTGNRVTCRDWFQLSLKEGLTVFRDRQFVADQRPGSASRIKEVRDLRTRQFSEDASSLAHPVRPQEVMEINNFYTATIYEKGAEIIRMLLTLLGEECYRQGLALYLERHDGEACTIDQFLACFEEVSGSSLAQFSRWYDQAGTPRLTVEQSYHAKEKRLDLHLRQYTPPTPGQPKKNPLTIPINACLYQKNGQPIENSKRILRMHKERQSFSFENIDSDPVVSLLGGFSAPVILQEQKSAEKYAFILAHDCDPFNRWEAAHNYVLTLLTDASQGQQPDLGAYIDALARAVFSPDLAHDFRALLLSLPSEEEILHYGWNADLQLDLEAIREARDQIALEIVLNCQPQLLELESSLRSNRPYSPDAASAGSRSLANACLSLLARVRNEPVLELVQERYLEANNMTDQMASLVALYEHGGARAAAPMANFAKKWADEHNIIDKWFALQARSHLPQAAKRIKELTKHPHFDYTNPNRFRSVIGAFAVGNQVGFHKKDGSGYRIVEHWIAKIDAINPQTAARIATLFENWRHFDEARRQKMQQSLRKLLDRADCSKNLRDILSRMLGD